MSQRVQSIERAIDILNVLAAGPKTLTEVARLSRLPKGTASRLLASLAYGDLVLKDPFDRAYVLGPGLMRLVRSVTQSFDPLVTLARPELTRLWVQTQETISLHVRLGTERVCIEELPSPNPLRYTASVGASAPLHIGSAGKVLLALQEPARLPSIVATLSMQPLTQRTIIDREELMAELETVRRSGWATSEGERVLGAVAVSVPLRGTHGEIIALSVLGPTQRLDRTRLMALVPKLKKSAAVIESSFRLRETGAR